MAKIGDMATVNHDASPSPWIRPSRCVRQSVRPAGTSPPAPARLPVPRPRTGVGGAAARPVPGVRPPLVTRLRERLWAGPVRRVREVGRGVVVVRDALRAAGEAVRGRGASRAARVARRLLGRRGRRYARYAAVSTRAWVDRGSGPGPGRIALNIASAVAFALIARQAPNFLPAAGVGLFLILGSTLVSPRHLVRDAALIGVIVLVVLALTGEQIWSLVPVTGVCLGAVGVGWVQRRTRSAADSGLGDAAAADAVLLDLRDEMLIRSAHPVLPEGWRLDSDLSPAHGDTFSGDFLLTQRPGPDELEMVLVDVSGNGYQAGARALLLAGAMRALLDVVPAGELIAATNHHVIRLDSDLAAGEGFATAVHLRVDLAGGGFVVTGAGHPPVAHYHAGSGRWEVLDGEQGPALGVLAEAEYPAISGRLGRGDALMLYTDGLVENRALDVGRGIDRLVGRADPLIARGVEQAAAQITGAIRTEEGDDRALVILRRG